MGPALTPSAPSSTILSSSTGPAPPSTLALLRDLRTACAAAALLPLPAVVITNPASSTDVGCLYLGLSCAWLAAEILCRGGLPVTTPQWRTKLFALWLAMPPVVALFTLMGLAAGTESRIPFPLLAILSTTPALGLVPWLVLRLREPFLAIILAAMTLVTAKLAACVVARLVYGPDFIAMGYVAGDWRTAKLMITLFWTLTVLLSLVCALAADRRIARSSL